MHKFTSKFIDVMIGVILGLGFQWWPNLHQPWQYIAFIFAYLDIIDYWIDYAPSLKKFPPKRETDLIIDVAIMFSLFLYIYSTGISLQYYLMAFATFRLLDFIWLIRSRVDYHPEGSDKTFVDTWLYSDAVETVAALILIIVVSVSHLPILIPVFIFITIRIIMRVQASVRYKQIYFS